MKIQSINLLKYNHQTRYQSSFRYNNLKPLHADTVSFGAMKKSQFKGMDLIVVNRFKAPIEKFNNNEDLQKWCEDKTKELKEKDISGRDRETTKQRVAEFRKWCSYTQSKKSPYSNAAELLILSGILKNIKKNNSTEIMPFNKKALKSTMKKILQSKDEVSFSDQYRSSLQDVAIHGLKNNLDRKKTGWVMIPSVHHDVKHFENNIEKLKVLSYKTWCTSSFNAETCLCNGDIHIYLENKKPKLAVRFYYDKIVEIQGEKNILKIPIKYLDILHKHIAKYELSETAQNELSATEKAQEKLKKVQEKLKKQGVDFKTCSIEQLFDALEISYEIDEEGFFAIDKYEQKFEDLKFDDMGINENELFKKIRMIKGNADFENSKVTNLGNLETIGGNAIFHDSDVTNLGGLKRIEGEADFTRANMTSLNDLQFIGKDAIFHDSDVTSLGNLQTVGGDVYINYSNLKPKDFQDVEIKGRIR